MVSQWLLHVLDDATVPRLCGDVAVACAFQSSSSSSFPRRRIMSRASVLTSAMNVGIETTVK